MKWRWLIQWMSKNLHHQYEVFQCQILKYSMRGLLQHWTESSIILTSKEESVWRNKKAQKQDRFLRGRQIAYLIYEYFRVTGANGSVENYADLFTIALRNDDIQEVDSKWDGILLSMTKIQSDDIFDGLYKLRIRESEKLKIVLELYDLEVHQKKIGPDYHRLKTMVKRSIEQDLRNRNCGARNGNYLRNAVVKNQGTKQREQRILGDCGQWESNGQCSRGDNCSFRHDINNRGKMTQSNPSPNSFVQQNERKTSRTRSPRGRSPSGRMFRWPCKDYLKGTCINSFCEKWHPPECLFYKTKSGCKFGEKCSYAHRQVDEQRAAVSMHKSSTPWIGRTSWRAYPSRSIQSMASLFKHIVVGQVWMNWKWAHKIFLKSSEFFCCSWFRSQPIAIHCNRRRV